MPEKQTPGTPAGFPAVGMVGGGQLARMTQPAAVALGVRLRVLAESADSSAAQVVPDAPVGDHRDAAAVRAFAAGSTVESYAYARTGYHRGLDALRRSGWKGHGPVPWSHEPNRGFLRALHALGRAAGAIGETEEEQRIAAFLTDSDPTATAAIAAS